MTENQINYQERINFAESTIGRMLRNVKKKTSTRLSFEESVLLLELVGFAIQQMRTVIEAEVAEVTKDDQPAL